MILDTLEVARIFHVLAVVIWIGGVAFVTAIVLPVAAQLRNAEDRAAIFERIERRFAWIARGATLVVGLSGFYMVAGFHIWERFAQPSFWWMHAMVALWAMFAILLFVIEPFWLHRRFARWMRQDSDHAFKSIRLAHWVLLLASLATIGAAVAGAHGYLPN